MRIGIFFPDYHPDAGGGYTFEREIFESIIALASESKHTFILFVNKSFVNSWSKEINLNSKVNIVILPKSSLVRRVFGEIRCALNKTNKYRYKYQNELQYIARQKGVHMIWFPTPVYEPVEIPYIATVWDIQHRVQPWFPEVGVDRDWNPREIFFSNLLRRATYIISPNQAGMRELSFFYQIPEERIKAIQYPTPRFAIEAGKIDSENILQKYNLPHNYLFYPAQFWPHKNHVNLLYAVRILLDKFDIKIPLVFVGAEKGNKDYIQETVRELELQENVFILGYVPTEDLIALYQNAFALTYVTFFGPGSIPPLEAFALGCPVIASNVSGAHEQLGDCAILVDPRSPDEIANAIKSLWDNPEFRQELISRGYGRKVWTGLEFVRSVFEILDEFENVRNTWSAN
jgi:glycosyltransferase involved in cell wall biosynthesis